MKKTTRVIPTSVRINPKTRAYCLKEGLSFKAIMDLGPDWRDTMIALEHGRKRKDDKIIELSLENDKLAKQNKDLMDFKMRRLEEMRAKK